MPRLARVFLVLLLLVFSGSALRAHDVGLSIAELRVRADTLELTVSFAVGDVRKMLPPSVELGTDSSVHTIEAARSELDQLASLLWEVRLDNRPFAPLDTRVEFTPSDNLGFRFTYPRPQTGILSFRAANLGGLPATHREVFTCFDEAGRARIERVLAAVDNRVDVSLEEMAADPAPAREAAPVSAGLTFREFFKLGVEHIWTGYDHLLFLLGLLLVCRSFRSIVTIITCFTLAHSLTLGLAALEVVSVPSWLIEPLIAGSIVYVGVENLLLRGREPKGRGWLTFAFGLIHGFGFASVLRDLGIGANGGGIALPLVSFNLGVEAGQVVVAAVVLPFLIRLFRSEKIRLRAVPAASALVAAAGLYWLIERTLFG